MFSKERTWKPIIMGARTVCWQRKWYKMVQETSPWRLVLTVTNTWRKSVHCVQIRTCLLSSRLLLELPQKDRLRRLSARERVSSFSLFESRLRKSASKRCGRWLQIPVEIWLASSEKKDKYETYQTLWSEMKIRLRFVAQTKTQRSKFNQNA